MPPLPDQLTASSAPSFALSFPRFIAPSFAPSFAFFFALSFALPLFLCLTASVFPRSAQAAEGHYSVEEADLLPKGSCRLSGWAHRGLGNPLRTGVLAPQCGLGPIELEFELGRERDAIDRRWSTPLSTTIKWGKALSPDLLAAIHVEFEFEEASRLEQTRVTLPLTWRPRAGLTTHFNLGRELVRGGRDRSSGGAAVEWAMTEHWSLLAERFRLEGAWASRAGIRRRIGYAWKVDLSRTTQTSPHHLSWWTIGLMHLWGRDEDD